MKLLLKYLMLLLWLFAMQIGYTQECWFSSLFSEVKTGNADFNEFIKTNRSSYRSYQLLYTDAPELKTNVEELRLVADNLEEIEKIGSYTKWKKDYNAGGVEISKLVESGDFSAKGTNRKVGRNTFTQSEDIRPAILPYGETALMKVKDLKFMQGSISNQTGDYFVLQNAYNLKKGENLPASNIKIWYNKAEGVDGFWTVDHRRLAAYKLAGKKDIKVEYLAVEDLMSRHAFKMTTESKGTDIRINVDIDKITGKFVNVKKLPKGSPRPRRESWFLREQPDGSLLIERSNGDIMSLDDILNYLPDGN